MHELSIVAALIDLCEENMRVNNASSVDEVHVKIGKLSGVEVDLFKSCFETFKLESPCKNAKLFVQIPPLVVRCEACSFEGEISENVFACPKCGEKLEVIEGEELFLQSLVLS